MTHRHRKTEKGVGGLLVVAMLSEEAFSCTQSSIDFDKNAPTLTQLSWGCSQDDVTVMSSPSPRKVYAASLSQLSQLSLGIPQDEDAPVATPTPKTMSQVSFCDDPELENFQLSQPLPSTQEEEHYQEIQVEAPVIAASLSGKDARRAESIKMLSFDTSRFSEDAIHLASHMLFFCGAPTPSSFFYNGLPGLSLKLNRNKTKGSRVVFECLMNDECTRELDIFVALTVAMARMGEMKIRRKATASSVKRRYKSMLDIFYIFNYLFHVLYQAVIPCSESAVFASPFMARSTLERHPTEDDCHMAILKLVQVLHLSQNNPRLLFRLAYSLFYSLAGNFWVELENVLQGFDSEVDLGGILWRVHQFVESNRDEMGVVTVRPGFQAFPSIIAAFALETCITHPSTMCVLEGSVQSYRSSVKDEQHTK